MKRWSIIFVIVLVALIVASYFVYRHEKKHAAGDALPTPTVAVTMQPTPTQAYCKPTDVQTALAIDHAAGNVYGTFTMKNVSTKPCVMLGNNIQAIYMAKNISVIYQGSGSATLQLAPHQTVYAQVHYPNGPQCNGPIQTAPISFQYTLAPQTTITFKDSLGNTHEQIAACASPTAITTVTLWPFSTTPYH